jgi:hypothetical protein
MAHSTSAGGGQGSLLENGRSKSDQSARRPRLLRVRHPKEQQSTAFSKSTITTTPLEMPEPSSEELRRSTCSQREHPRIGLPSRRKTPTWISSSWRHSFSALLSTGTENFVTRRTRSSSETSACRPFPSSPSTRRVPLKPGSGVQGAQPVESTVDVAASTSFADAEV